MTPQISEAELRVDYSKIGAHQVAEFADVMLQVADANSDGVINFEEYNRGFNSAAGGNATTSVTDSIGVEV